MTKKLVIITEKLIIDEVIGIIEELGATGFTVLPAGGKGRRGERSEDRAHLVEEFGNVQIEVITGEAAARTIADRVGTTYFHRYSGMAYMADVEVLQPAMVSSNLGS